MTALSAQQLPLRVRSGAAGSGAARAERHRHRLPAPPRTAALRCWTGASAAGGAPEGAGGRRRRRGSRWQQRIGDGSSPGAAPMERGKQRQPRAAGWPCAPDGAVAERGLPCLLRAGSPWCGKGRQTGTYRCPSNSGVSKSDGPPKVLLAAGAAAGVVGDWEKKNTKNVSVWEMAAWPEHGRVEVASKLQIITHMHVFTLACDYGDLV